MNQIYSVDVTITAPVKQTEIKDRVIEAITAIFPEADIETKSDRIVAQTHSVNHFSELLTEQQIVDTARDILFANIRNQTISFDLKKQAAYRGIVNFAVGNPAELGDIHVEITINEPDPDEFIDQIAPPTETEER
ncbi:MAG: RNA-binding domain-containing protein, partial [Halobacteriaceae archaeon]